MKFGQLNTISAYSFNGSIIDIEKYVINAKEKGYSYIGINDINIFNYPKLETYALKYNLKPIFLYHIKIKINDSINIEASLLIKNEKGYSSICKIINLNKEVIELSNLDNYTDGLCIIVETNLNYEYKLFQDIIARELSKIRKLFDDRFYLGLEIYTKDDLDNINEIVSFATTCSYKIIPFPKVLYLNKSDAYYYSILKASIEAKEEIELENEGPYFLLSNNALNQLYSSDSLIELEKLLDEVDFTFFKKRGELISFTNDDQILEKKIKDSLIKNNLNNDEYKKRAEYELDIIKKMKFSSYFLLVEDYVSFARNNNIKIGPSRGSAGGSLICFLLGITSLDPIKFNLSFERFLNPKRVTMPDIDIDFDSNLRDEVVQYLYNKYKEKDTQVSNIIVFSTLKPRSAIKLVAPILGYPNNTIAKLIDSISPSASDFTKAKEDTYYGSKFKNILKEKTYDKLIKTANVFIGLPINTSIHASGIIVSNNSLLDCLHVIKKDNIKVCCFEYETMEKLGFLKLDILSLKNLTFIKEIEDNIKNNKKELINVFNDLENKEVYKTLNNKLLFDIFQLDNSKIVSKYIDLVKPNSFKDLCELIDLIRPGAKDYVDLFARRKNGKEKISYLHKLLEPILKETYGIMLYQEQIMEVAKVIASFSLAEADLLRRAISKKSEEDIKKYHNEFINGATKNNIAKDISEKIYSDIKRFSNYGFNKAHSYGYGLITYLLLYYKTFFTTEFYISSINNTIIGSNDFEKVLKEIKYFNYHLGVVDINYSLPDSFTFNLNTLYLPLRIKGINNNFINEIYKQREKGNYASFVDFIIRNKELLLKEENTTSLNKLILAGAFDSFSKKREELSKKYNLFIKAADFFSSEQEINNLNIKLEDKEINLGKRLLKEKENIGIICSYKMENKNNYHTFIIKDKDEVYSRIEVVSNFEEYIFKYDKLSKINIGDFVEIRADLNNNYKVKLIDDIKIIGKRSIKI